MHTSRRSKIGISGLMVLSLITWGLADFQPAQAEVQVQVIEPEGRICTTITLVSGPGTDTTGYTETTQSSSATALIPTSYTPGTWGPATPTTAVIPPWIDPATDPNFIGSGAVWVSTHATWPGGAGNSEGSGANDQWRLFRDSFSLPSGATVNSAQVWYTADNAAEVYHNSSSIGGTSGVYGPVPPGTPHHFESVFNTSFSPTVGLNNLDFVLRNWGGISTNPTGLLYKAVIDYCIPEFVTVTIAKYLDGSHATAVSANNTSFPMTSSWNATNIGAGSGNYSLGPSGFNNPNPYEATTSDMSSGADYTTSETTDGNPVLPSWAPCEPGKYRLIGYSWGETETEAMSALVGPTPPNFTGLTSNKFVIVWNETCPVPTPETACDLGMAPPGYTLQYGTPGNDIVFLAPNTMFVGLGGNDSVMAGNGDYIICLGNGNDLVKIGHGNSVIHAGSGNNNVMTGNGTHKVIAGSGNDKVATGSGNDWVDAGHGDNHVKTTGGMDTIYTGSGNDFVDGGSGTDSCSAGSGLNIVWNCP